jgi:linoleoyl-CoA desaturase
MKSQQMKFDSTKNTEFATVLKARVNAYFDESGRKRQGGFWIVSKTIIMLALYLIPFVLLLLNIFPETSSQLGLWLFMAVGMSGIGLGVMHDANHGASFKSSVLNDILGKVIYLVGVDQLNWKIQHNVLHHTFTNIDGHDDSLEAGNLLRFSPHQPLLKHHKYQHYYAWLLYTLQTISWSILTDYNRLRKYIKMEIIPGKKSNARLYTEMFLGKIIYFGLILILPVFVINSPWWLTASFFLLMHLAAGFFLACVFLPAHIMPENEYPLPEESGDMKSNWLVHQIETSCNFATGSRSFSWFVGGLNYQIEHHLFPNICHIHYPAISKILKETVNEFNIPYRHYKTFFGAIKAHGVMIKKLGR